MRLQARNCHPVQFLVEAWRVISWPHDEVDKVGDEVSVREPGCPHRTPSAAAETFTTAVPKFRRTEPVALYGTQESPGHDLGTTKSACCTCGRNRSGSSALRNCCWPGSRFPTSRAGGVMLAKVVVGGHGITVRAMLTINVAAFSWRMVPNSWVAACFGFHPVVRAGWGHWRTGGFGGCVGGRGRGLSRGCGGLAGAGGVLRRAGPWRSALWLRG